MSVVDSRTVGDRARDILFQVTADRRTPPTAAGVRAAQAGVAALAPESVEDRADILGVNESLATILDGLEPAGG